mgnify:CR=1 FL=1
MDMTSRDIRLTEMKDAVTKLNNTVESLKKAFEESQAREAQKDQKIEDMKAIDAQKDQKIASLEEKVAYLTKKIFAAKSEKSKDFPGQLNLFNEVEAERDPSAPEQVEPINVDELQTSDTYEGKTRKKRQHVSSLHSKGKGREAPYDEGDGIRLYCRMDHVSEILQQQPAVQAGKRMGKPLWPEGHQGDFCKLGN